MKSVKEMLTFVLLAGTALGVVGGGFATVSSIGENKIHSLVAQEMKSRDYQMEYLMAQEREREDEKKIAVCLETKSAGRCALESEHRQNTWRWIDCTQVGEDLQVCGPKPELRL